MGIPRGWSYSPSDTALLIIDAQNDFLAPGGAASNLLPGVSQRSRFLTKLRTLAECARNAGIRVIFSRLEFSSGDHFLGRCRELPGLDQLWDNPRAFMRQTWGSDFYSELQPKKGDVLLPARKNIGLFSTNSEPVFKKCGITKLILAGVGAETAIGGAAYTAKERGYEVAVARDATAIFSRIRNRHPFLLFTADLVVDTDLISELMLSPPLMELDSLSRAKVLSNDGGWVGNVIRVLYRGTEAGFIEAAPANPYRRLLYLPVNTICKASERRVLLRLPGSLVDCAEAGWRQELVEKNELAAA